MTTNKEFLDELASHGDGSLQAWFDAEHTYGEATHESRENYEERLYDVEVSDCPYCGCSRVVIHDFCDSYERPHSYRVEHVDEREAFNCECFESYFAFDSIEKAVEHADMREGYRDEHPKNMYVSAEDFEWLEENLRSEHVQKLDELDSREKLEADIHKWLGMWTAVSVQQSTIEKAVHGWLDRQAAITESEGRERWHMAASGEVYLANNRTAILEEENSELREQLSEAMRYGHAITMLGDLSYDEGLA